MLPQRHIPKERNPHNSSGCSIEIYTSDKICQQNRFAI
jgi:hypothetical protein